MTADQTMERKRYPYDDGDVTVIGPECFALKDGSVLCWRGQNWTLQRKSLRVRFYNWRVTRSNRRTDV
jgi:hypothetical protein